MFLAHLNLQVQAEVLMLLLETIRALPSSPIPPPPALPSESIEWFIECQAFLRSYDPPPLRSASCLSFLVFMCVAGPDYWGERGGRRGRAWSRILRPQESLALFKSFNTLWPPCTTFFRKGKTWSPWLAEEMDRSLDSGPRDFVSFKIVARNFRFSTKIKKIIY